jgi:hypothetical protein
MNVNFRSSVLILSILFAAAPAMAGAQAALRVTPVVGRTVYFTDPPAAMGIAAAGSGDLIVHNGKLRDAFTAGALVGVHFGNEWEVEGLFSRTRTTLASEELTGGSIEAISYMYGAHVNYHITAGRAAPYLSLGAGGESWEYNAAEAELDNHPLIYAGGGVDLRIAEFFGVRIDARDCISRAESLEGGNRSMHHLMLLSGITFMIPTK